MELNCTSGRSYPATTLQWYLNDLLVTDPNNIIQYPSVQTPHGLITTFLGLSMVVNHRHYIDGTIRIKCVASLSPVLWRGGQESIVQWEQESIDSRVAMLLVKSNAMSRNRIFIVPFLSLVLYTICPIHMCVC
uniref:CD80-like immunoglobulin C2-set domain-containing protein n=1 Tax=Anopheles christyi TaxID=43041 RepID=A0A182KF82_9DIPT